METTKLAEALIPPNFEMISSMVKNTSMYISSRNSVRRYWTCSISVVSLCLWSKSSGSTGLLIFSKTNSDVTESMYATGIPKTLCLISKSFLTCLTGFDTKLMGLNFLMPILFSLVL